MSACEKCDSYYCDGSCDRQLKCHVCGRFMSMATDEIVGVTPFDPMRAIALEPKEPKPAHAACADA